MNRRYPGYSAADRAQPYAKYLTTQTVPAQPHVLDAYDSAPTPARLIPEFEDWTSDLAPTGHSAVETGYGQSPCGSIWVAVHTAMPRVTAAMWDWWFHWHLTESARYKLWHPDAHMFAEVTARRSASASGYVGITSYVDEYIGPKLQQLAITFHPPRALGFAIPQGHTVIAGRVGSSIAPVDLGWLAHQVRPTPDGAEMRSRVYISEYGQHAPNPREIVRAIARGPAADIRDLRPGTAMARELMLHCGQEMNHLAQFLPELYAEFG